MVPIAVQAQAIWVSEHYWPGLAEELVLAQAERLARLSNCVAAVVLPGQQTAFAHFAGASDDDVRQALVRAGVAAATLTPGWRLARPSGTPSVPPPEIRSSGTRRPPTLGGI